MVDDGTLRVASSLCRPRTIIDLVSTESIGKIRGGMGGTCRVDGFKPPIVVVEWCGARVGAATTFDLN